MNILCVEQFSNWGGGQRSLLDLLPAFAERGWRPQVVLPGEGPFAEELRALGYPTSLVKSATYKSLRKPRGEMWKYACELPRLAGELAKLVDNSNSTLIYVNGPRPLPPSALVARRKGIPLVFHCHHRLQQSSAILLTGASLKLSGACTVASCEHAAQPIRKYAHPRRLFVRYNGVFGPPRPRPISNLKRIGVIGRIEREKGQLEFVRAVRVLVKQFSGCSFTIIGSPMFSNADYYDDVLAESRGLPVEFTAWQNDISDVFGNLDMVVVPSSALEATTRVIMEAFAFGVPVIAFPSGGIPEILKDNQTGFLTEGTTADALARRIDSVLRMRPKDLKEVTARARETWQDHFTIERYRKDICDILSWADAVGNLSSCADVSHAPASCARTVR